MKITKVFRNKLECFKGNIPTETESDASMFKELEDFIISMDKHINLVERRILKGEKIPHNEKLFSIFEQHKCGGIQHQRTRTLWFRQMPRQRFQWF